MRPVSKSLNINAEVKKCFSVCFKRTDIWLRIINQPPYIKESTRKYIQRVEENLRTAYCRWFPVHRQIAIQWHHIFTNKPIFELSPISVYERQTFLQLFLWLCHIRNRTNFILSLLEHKHRIQQTSDDLEILAIQHLHGVPIVSEYDDGTFLQQSIRFEWNHSILLIDTGCLFFTNECQQLCFFRWKGLSLQLNVKLH